MTALDLITSALRLINVMASGEAVPIDMANESLSVLNDMIDAWNTDRQAIYTVQSSDFPYVLSQQTYTLGTGGNFNIARPARIEGMSTILLYSASNPVEIPLRMYSVQDWQEEVPVKSVSGSFPLLVYDDGAFPLRNLSFWPIPTVTPNNVRIYYWSALPAQTLASTISFPPGYNQGLRYNLAVLLANEYARQIPPSVAQIAADSLARIRSINAPELSLRSDLVPSNGEFDYKADLFGIGM